MSYCQRHRHAGYAEHGDWSNFHVGRHSRVLFEGRLFDQEGRRGQEGGSQERCAGMMMEETREHKYVNYKVAGPFQILKSYLPRFRWNVRRSLSARPATSKQ